MLQRTRPRYPDAWHRHGKTHHLRLQSTNKIRASETLPTVEYRIAASFSAKDDKFNAATDYYNFKLPPREEPLSKDIIVSKPGKRKKPRDAGQDAYFVSTVGGSRAIAFGVADGVGGWADSGVNPADFSHGFCKHMAEIASNSAEEEELTASDLMAKGYKTLVTEEKVAAGASTACVGVARPDGSVEVAK